MDPVLRNFDVEKIREMAGTYRVSAYIALIIMK